MTLRSGCTSAGGGAARNSGNWRPRRRIGAEYEPPTVCAKRWGHRDHERGQRRPPCRGPSQGASGNGPPTLNK
jgi:hypothetical protein